MDINRAARIFWKTAIEEFKNGDAVLLVPDEVRRELEVQFYTLSDKEKRKIRELLSMCEEIVPSRVSVEIEHVLRIMSNYVRAHYKKEIGRNRMEYGGVSDMRILYTAYVSDAILVTANTRDFLLYPLLFAQHEERLYDVSERAFISIPEDGYKTIHADPQLKRLLQDFFELDQEAEDMEDTEEGF